MVVVGAGGAGMTAALAAAKHGLDTVLVEKSAYFGGSTARSGGGVWIPGNYALREAGQADDPATSTSKLYLDSIVGDVVPKVRRDTYLDRGPEVMDFIRERTPVRFAWVPEYADYHPEQPGGRAAGRSVEPVPMDARFLGDELERLHPQYTKAPANLIVTQADFRKISLGLRTWRGPVTMVKVLVRRMVEPAARPPDVRDGQRDRDRPAQGPGRRRRARPLRHRADRPRCSRTAAWSASGSGPATAPHEIRARRGVILGSGGFEKNLEMREKYQPSPDLRRLDDRLAVQHRRRHPRRHRGRRGDRPARRRLVGPDDPAADRARGSAWPSATCPARSSSTPPASGS